MIDSYKDAERRAAEEKRFWDAYRWQKEHRKPLYFKCEACNGTSCGFGDNGACEECNGYGEMRELP